MMKYLLIVLIYFSCFIIGYALGSFNLAYIIGKSKGFDIRERGSFNAGASNAVVNFGWPIGILVGACDFGKAVLAFLLCKFLFQDYSLAPYIAGVATVFGHCFPFYLNFKGGKGTGTYFGLMLIINWKIALIIIVIVAIITLITKFIVYGTFTTILLFPIACYFEKGWLAALIILCGSLLILFMHRVNIKRLINHTEIPIPIKFKKQK